MAVIIDNRQRLQLGQGDCTLVWYCRLSGSYSPLAVPRSCWLLLVASYLVLPIFNGEIFLNVVTGRWILAHQQLPDSFFWSIDGVGSSWGTPLPFFDLVVALADRWGGVRGLALLYLCCSVLLVFGLERLYSQLSGSRAVGGLLVVAAVSGSLVTYSFSSAIWIWLVLASVLNLLPRIAASRSAQMLTVVLMISGAGAVHLFVLLLLVLVHAALCLKIAGRRCAIVLTLLSVPALMIGIYNGGSYQIGWAIEPLEKLRFDYGAAFTLLFWIMLVVIEMGRQQKRISELLFRYLPLLFLSLLGFAAPSLIGVSLVVLGFHLAASLSPDGVEVGVGSAAARLSEAFLRFGDSLRRVVAHSPQGFAWVALCLIVVNVVQLWRTPIYSVMFPAGELAQLVKDPGNFPLLHGESSAAYLIYGLADERGEPRQPVSVAPRSFVGGSGDTGAGWAESRMRWFEELGAKTALLNTVDPLLPRIQGDSRWSVVRTEDGNLSGTNITGSGEKPSPWSWVILRKL